MVEIFNNIIIVFTSFQNSGKAALGPALYLSVLMASKCSRSSFFVFTNGVANLGQGALENDLGQRLEADDFYSNITELAIYHK